MATRDGALDGMRAIAAVAVVLVHTDQPLFRNGFFGVDVFFVLSGFLITRSLLTEKAETGGLDIRGFLLRRVLRLYPALFAMLTLTVAFEMTRDNGINAILSAASAVFYVSNAFFFSGHMAPSLAHTWTLGIEEQFYIVWPAILLVVCKPNRFVKLFIAALAASCLVVIAANPIDHKHLAIDGVLQMYVRAGGLIYGSVLAMVMLFRPFAKCVAGLNLAGLGATVYLVVSMFDGGFGKQLFLNRYLSSAALATLVVVAAVVSDSTSRLSRLLGALPLAWLGRRSYSLYLWHLPLFVFFSGSANRPPSISRWLVLTSALLVLTHMSYALLEKHAQRGRRFHPQVAGVG